MKNIIIILIVFTQYGCANEIYYFQSGKKIDLTPLPSLSRNVSNIDYYTNNNEIVLGVTERLLVKFKDASFLKSVIKEYDLVVIRKLDKNLYLLKTQDKNFTLSISNALSKKDFIEYAQPDFIKKLYRR